MYQVLSEFLLELSRHKILWAVCVIAAMAITAVTLYVLWDLVARGVALARPRGRSPADRRSDRGH